MSYNQKKKVENVKRPSKVSSQKKTKKKHNFVMIRKIRKRKEKKFNKETRSIHLHLINSFPNTPLLTRI